MVSDSFHSALLPVVGLPDDWCVERLPLAQPILLAAASRDDTDTEKPQEEGLREFIRRYLVVSLLDQGLIVS